MEGGGTPRRRKLPSAPGTPRRQQPPTPSATTTPLRQRRPNSTPQGVPSSMIPTRSRTASNSSATSSTTSNPTNATAAMGSNMVAVATHTAPRGKASQAHARQQHQQHFGSRPAGRDAPQKGHARGNTASESPTRHTASASNKRIGGRYASTSLLPSSTAASQGTTFQHYTYTPTGQQKVTLTNGPPDFSMQEMEDEGPVDTTSQNVIVSVRVRPFNQREVNLASPVVLSMSGRTTNIVNPDKGKAHTFHYDHSFWSHDRNDADFTSQEKVYEYLGVPLLDRCLEGYNCSLFAYGQTGSGKSYSMMGIPGSYVTIDENSGIIPRFTDHMFDRMHEETSNKVYTVEVSYFEIYSERIYDLLAPPSKGKMQQLRVREHPIMGPYVEGLKTYAATSFNDIEGWLNVGSKHRATASTNMNATSSRSHAVFTMVVTQTEVDEEGDEHTKVSKVNLVDLAGSERSDVAGTSGIRLREGSAINKSLHTLGKVISLLADRSMTKKKIFIPYRDSVLTWILKESLGGNAKTAMLATLSPALANYDETLSTLRYAHQARQIVNAAQVNEDPNSKLISDLRKEIEMLRGMVTGKGNEQEVAALRDKLKTTQSLMAAMNRSWEEKLRIAEESRLQNSLNAARADDKLPKLVNLNEDPQLSEMLIYSLTEGDVVVGSSEGCDVQLGGALLLPHHCTITTEECMDPAQNDGFLYLITVTAQQEALVFVNGHGVAAGEAVQVHHSDRILFGNHHFFRLAVPNTAAELNRGFDPDAQEKNYAFAKEEYDRVQAELLKEEIRKESERLTREKEEEWERQMLEQRKAYEERMKALEGTIASSIKEKEQFREMAEKTARSLQQEEQEKHKLGDQLSQLQAEKERMEQLQSKFKSESDAYKRRITSVKSFVEGDSRYKNIGAQFFATTQTFTEANRIAKQLAQSTLFTMASDNDTPMVKVVNTELKVSTLWPIEKYEEKLDEMRQLYADYETTGQIPEGVGMVFFDPAEEWKSEDFIQLQSDQAASRVLSGRGSASAHRLSLDPNALASYDFSSASSLRNSAVRRRTKTPAKELNDAYNAEPSVTAIASRYLRNISKCLTDDTGKFSLTHELVSSLSSLKLAVNLMQETFEAHSQKSDAILKLRDTGAARNTSVSATLAMNAITSIVRNLRSHAETGPVLQLAQRLASSTETCANDVIKLIQGIENEIPSMVESGHSDCVADIQAMSTIAGELAIILEPSGHGGSGGDETDADAEARLREEGVLDEDDDDDEDVDDDGRSEQNTRRIMAARVVDLPTAGRVRSSAHLDAQIATAMTQADAVDSDVLKAFFQGTQAYVKKAFDACKQDLTQLPKRIDELKRSLGPRSLLTTDALSAAKALTAKTIDFILASEALQVELTQQNADGESALAAKQTFYNKNFSRTKGVISQVQSVSDAVAWFVESCALVCVGQDDVPQLMARGKNIRSSAAHLLSAAEFKSSRRGKGERHIYRMRDNIQGVYSSSTAFNTICEEVLSKKSIEQAKAAPVMQKSLGTVARRKMLMETKAEIIRLEQELESKRHHMNHLNQADYNTATSDI